jgi:superfamily II RNA helicase
VTHDPEHTLLVVAGQGSGKTWVTEYQHHVADEIV